MYALSPLISLLCLGMSCAGTACAQDTALDGIGIVVNATAAKVIKHEPKFTLPIPALTTGLDVALIFHTSGTKDWQQRRNFPAFGVAFGYVNYGIDSIYGRCFAIYPTLIIPLFRNQNWDWTARLGDGLGYVTKTYSRAAPVDTLNVAIGSHLDDYAMVATDITRHIGQRWDIDLGVHMNHISDASVHKPNLGINNIGIHLGVAYAPATLHPKKMIRKLPTLSNRWLVQARTGMAMVASYTAGGPVYPVYTATAFVSRRWMSKNKLFAGIDYSYHENIYAFLRNNGIDAGSEAQNSYKSAVIAGNEFLFGRVGLFVQAGWYLRQAYIRMDPVYEKLGGNLYLVQKENGPVKEFFIYGAVKTDLTVAEFAEFGLGLGF